MTPRKPLEAGERCRIYSDAGIFTAKIVGPYGDKNQSLIDVEMPNGKHGSFYRKQCRRLRKKAKPPSRERIGLWVLLASYGPHGVYAWNVKREELAKIQSPEQTLVRFEEVPADSRVVSREDVLQAFGLAFTMPGNTHKQMDPTLGLALLAAMGFPEGEKK